MWGKAGIAMVIQKRIRTWLLFYLCTGLPFKFSFSESK